MWQNSKTQIVSQLKNSKCDKTQKFKIRQNSNTQIVTKLKFWQNLNCDKTLTVTRLNLWQNLKQKISNCDNLKQHKLWQNWKAQIIIKRTIDDKSLLSITTWHLDNRWDLAMFVGWRYFSMLYTGCWETVISWRLETRVFPSPWWIFSMVRLEMRAVSAAAGYWGRKQTCSRDTLG